MRQRLGQLFSLFCVVFAAASFYNVLSDHAEVEALAKSSAPACSASCSMTRLDRSPVAQSFEFATRDGKTVAVRCARAALLVGPYACQPR